METSAGAGLVIFLLMSLVRAPELLALLLGLALLFGALVMVELAGKAVWRFLFGGKEKSGEGKALVEKQKV